MIYRDYTFLGTTQSLCPECLAVVPAKIVERAGRVYFRKRCPRHGPREDFVCSDVRWFDRNEFQTAGRMPQYMAVEPSCGCPYDCGLCTEHEQHTCLALLEINSACNLECPMCFAASGPGGAHLSVADCQRAIDHLVVAEGRPEILQLSGGEPTIHPQFLDILEYACRQPIDLVMINTNGIRLARDHRFLADVAEWRHRAEVYLQFDGFDDAVYHHLRGESLIETKLQAVERLGEVGLHTILVCTVQAGVNEHEIPRIVKFAMDRAWVTGVSFQPATYVGRFVLPDELSRRVTFPDVIRAVAEGCANIWRDTDFTPLPCAHPNAHTLAYAYRAADGVVPLARFVNIEEHIDLFSGRITFTRDRARELIGELLSRQCCPSGNCGPSPANNMLPILDLDQPHAKIREPMPFARTVSPQLPAIAQEFFGRAVEERLDPEDMFRITTTSFMDAYNFDLRQLMKSCVHFVLPSGHIIPFSAYNVLYRDGHVPLPPLRLSGKDPRGRTEATVYQGTDHVVV
jgi:uncharacterized radical SAM superfamily Fe-S cluster-containing enzyme